MHFASYNDTYKMMMICPATLLTAAVMLMSKSSNTQGALHRLDQMVKHLVKSVQPALSVLLASLRRIDDES